MDSTPVVHIRRGVRWRWLGLAEVWEYRGLLVSLGIRSVKLRYRQTFFGVAWVLLQPLLSAGIMTGVFGVIAAVPGPTGVPYFAFAYLGQMAWSLFSLTVARAAGSMVGSSAFITKIYFPRAILPLATVGGVLLDFAMSFALAVPMIVWYSRGPINVALAVLSAACLVFFGTGIGFILAAFSVRFRDVLIALPFLVQLGLYASPVAYGLDVARSSLVKRSAVYFDLYMLNPLASLIEAFRWSLLGQGLLLPEHIAYSAVCAVGVFVAGFVVFRSLEGKFADVI